MGFYGNYFNEASTVQQNETLSKIKEFNKELNSYEYGIFKNGKKYGMKNFFEYYKLESPQEFEKNKGGICWDFVHYQDYYFKKNFNNVKVKNFYIIIDDNHNCPTHTFTTFDYKGKHYLFESSWWKHRGVHEYNTEKDILDAMVYYHNLFYNKDKKFPCYMREFKSSEVRPGMNAQEYMSVMNKGLHKVNIPTKEIQSLNESNFDITFSNSFNDCNGYSSYVNYIFNSRCLYNEVSVNSKLDKEFNSKEHLKLDSFKSVRITKTQISKYKELKYCKSENCDGFVWLDNNKVVCYVNVETKDNDEKWIQALEVMKDYQGKGIAKQLLYIATSNLGAKYLSVNKKNEIAIKLYKDYGFKIYDETDIMYFMKLSR